MNTRFFTYTLNYVQIFTVVGVRSTSLINVSETESERT